MTAVVSLMKVVQRQLYVNKGVLLEGSASSSVSRAIGAAA